MGRDTIEGFFHHSEVPQLELTKLADTSIYKYTAEPTIKRVEEPVHNPKLLKRTGEPGQTLNKYYWLWKLNEWIGLRHLFMIFLVVAYTSIGAYLFYRIESVNEKQVYPLRVRDLNQKVLSIAKKFKENGSWNVTTIFDEFKRDYKGLLAFDNVYKWSTYYRTEVQYKWNPGSATFFAMNLYTTVGYGTIAAETLTGIALVMLYTMLFCPVTMVISRDLGQFGLVYLTKLYGYIKYMFTSTHEKSKISADDLIILPVKYGWMAMFGFLGLTTVFLYFYDGMTGPDTGLSWWECFYFSVQTYTTAGFGDIMPINATFDPVVGLVYFFCLPVLKVVNRMTYLYLENGIHGYFAIVESKINQYLNATLTFNKSLSANTTAASSYGKDYGTQEIEWANSLTIQSLAAMASSSADVYGGNLGRVNLRTADLQPSRKPSSAA
ncbi:Ion channel [Trichostrongylus colubriformis]|uniref:Ion channel n=1 Tax=Trichostrongylus colubriformis TaxID=6319 RepID=A0AAN8FQ54_TRICO